MNARRTLPLLLTLAVALVLAPPAAYAQTRTGQQKPGASASPAQTKQQPAKPAPASTSKQKDQPAAKPAQKPTSPETSASASATVPHTSQPVLLGQYDNWGAYWAAPDGRKICFAAARPNGASTNRGRKPAYLFIASRPHEKVKEEISVIASAPFRSKSDATATIGGKTYAMLTNQDGAWTKNAADEAKLLEAMRKGGELVVKGTTDRGLQSTDVYSMKGLAQALNRIARECK
ncbi:MAG TPA: invasion associated locus B family protein [Xanthobacteraceae bacterium]|nr:invasion associated locus B family protein [Xanthobacteraceae bacterium]